ncbi:hypothetical protein [[Phormidium] sp. ETS-05]|nr:hypothetical protein [[Phormidium] sp. ETS-05]
MLWWLWWLAPGSNLSENGKLAEIYCSNTKLTLAISDRHQFC